jgi:hypothetical protein
MKRANGRMHCDYAVKDVLIRWYAKDHPTRPGEVEVLPWCKDFWETAQFQFGGAGGFYAYRDHVRIFELSNLEVETPRIWLLGVLHWLTVVHGLDAATVSGCLCEIAEYMPVGDEGIEWAKGDTK